MIDLRPYDIVQATVEIRRVDRRAKLAPGEHAKVIRTFKGVNYLLVDVELKNGKPMINIACNDEAPFKLVWRNPR